MEWVSSWWFGLMCIGGGTLLFLLAMLKFRDNDIFFTSVPEGTIRFVVAGSKVVRYLGNIQGRRVDEETGAIGEDLTYKPRFLARTFGLFWVGIYPIRKVYEFQVKSIARLKDQLGDGENVESWVTYEDSKSVRELRWKIARPSFVPDVELGGDQTQVNFVVMVILQVTNVYKPVFEYGGNFLRAVDGIVANAVMDFASSEDAHGEKLTYKKLTGMKKGSSAGGGGENLIDRMKTQADRQLAEYGLSMVVAYLHDYDLSKDFRDIEEANRANELAKLQGDAKITAAKKQAEAAVEAAKGALEARKLEAEGEAAFWNFASEAHRNIGGDPNVLVAVRAQVAEAQALASEKSKVTTLVQRSEQVALQISPEKKVAS